MKSSHTARFTTIFFLLLGLNLTGCIATKTFPLRALPGETIALTLGRTSNEAGEGVTRANLVVTITDVNGVDHVIDGAGTGGTEGKLQSVFRTFADPLSQTAVAPPGGEAFVSGQIGALVDLPTDLPEGAAKVKWNVQNGKLPYYVFSFWPLGNWSNNIQLEVLPGGPGQPHVFQEKSAGYNDLTQLEPSPRIRFKLSTSNTTIGALEVQFNLDPVINPSGYNGYKPVQQYSYSTDATTLTSNMVIDNGSTFSKQTKIHLLRVAGGNTGSFKFYTVSTANGQLIDLSGVEGVTIDLVDPDKGTLDAGYFKAYDINGNLITDATMTLKVFNQP